MKKILILIITAILLSVTMTGCNYVKKQEPEKPKYKILKQGVDDFGSYIIIKLPEGGTSRIYTQVRQGE